MLLWLLDRSWTDYTSMSKCQEIESLSHMGTRHTDPGVGGHLLGVTDHIQG